MRNYKKGEELETTVLAIDPERERISLGVKQLDKDPFRLFLADHPKGSIIKGVIQELDAKMAHRGARRRHDRPARASEISRDRVEDARAVLKVGETVEAKFTGVDRKTRILSLSIKAKEAHEEAASDAELQDRRGQTDDGHDARRPAQGAD